MRNAAADVRVADLVRPSPILHPDDSLSKALHQLRLFPESALPVVANGSLVGLVAEADVLAAARRIGLDNETPGDFASVRVAEAMTPGVKTGLMETPLMEAWEAMASQGLKVMPILDAHGIFRGLIARNDILAALQRDLRPPDVGGLATPLGVYLTTGNHRAGAGDLGLLLTGVVMATCHLVVVNGLTALLALSQRDVPEWGMAIAEFLAFLLLLRATPLAGFHAAEHQVVHAIERGEPLVMAAVSRLPREHPRCGTNLVAVLFGAQILVPVLPNPAFGVVAALGLMLVWRRLGWLFQRWFTTKRATGAQLRSALVAGRSLLVAYGARPAYRAPWPRRFWLAGFTQMVAGFAGVLGVVQFLNLLFPQLGVLP